MLVDAVGARIDARAWGWRHAGRSDWALSGIDLIIAPGERVLLLGASGAGKSTFLHALAGVLGGDDDGEAHGELLVDGQVPDTVRGRVGLLLQDPDAQVILARVGDDVAFGCENLGVPRDEIWRRVDAALTAVGLALPLDHPTSALSGGQKQRLALAGLLAMQPGLLLLDEPTANLDADGVEEVRAAVETVVAKTGATLVVIEHRVSIWRELVDRVIVFSASGGVLADGAPDRVLAEQGESLAAAGVWVPEFPPEGPVRAPRRDTSTVLTTEALVIGRNARAVYDEPITVELERGRALAITGPNGSGKSTLALTLGGLLPPVTGTVRAAGLARGAVEEPISWKSKELLTRIGTVFQDPEHQFVAATVRDELAVGPRALGLPEHEIEARIAHLAARLRLDALLSANPFTLSGGEKRRLSVATVLSTRPPLVILDEPTFGQDSRTWQELVALLAELLDDGTSIVAVTHDTEFIAAIADQELRLAVPTRARRDEVESAR